MIDIDYFKTINDKYGHSVGDTVLQEFSNRTKDCIRGTDIIARWGGEEFIVLLLDTNYDICSNISEKIRQRIEKLVVTVGDEVINFTISMGATISCEKDESVDVIIDRADRLLYEAKNNGRNCLALDFSK